MRRVEVTIHIPEQNLGVSFTEDFALDHFKVEDISFLTNERIKQEMVKSVLYHTSFSIINKDILDE